MSFFNGKNFQIFEKLDIQGMTKLSEELGAFFEQRKIQSKLRTKLRLTVETILDNWHVGLPEETQISLSCVNFLNSRHIILEAKGEKCNPLLESENSDALESYSQRLLDQFELNPTFKYKDGINIVNIPVPSASFSPVLGTLLALAAAFATAGILKFFPSQIAQFTNKRIIEPLFDACINALEIFGILLIFFSIISSIANIRSRSLFSRYSSVVSKHLLKKNFLAAAMIFCTLPFFFTILKPDSSMESSFLMNIYEMFIKVIPQNIVEPFQTRNALQLMVIAFFSGYILFKLGKKAQIISQLANEMTIFATESITTICKATPFVIYLCVTQILTGGEAMEMLAYADLIWVTLAYTLIYLAMTVIPLSICYKIPLNKYIKDSFPFFMKGFLTRTSVTSITQNEQMTCEKYDVNHNFAKFVFPMMEVLYKVRFLICVCVNLIMVTNHLGMAIGSGTFFCLIISTFLACMVAPPVEGGILIIYGTLLSQINLPDHVLNILIILDIFQGMFTTGLFTMLMSAEAIAMDKKLKR